MEREQKRAVFGGSRWELKWPQSSRMQCAWLGGPAAGAGHTDQLLPGPSVPHVTLVCSPVSLLRHILCRLLGRRQCISRHFVFKMAKMLCSCLRLDIYRNQFQLSQSYVCRQEKRASHGEPQRTGMMLYCSLCLLWLLPAPLVLVFSPAHLFLGIFITVLALHTSVFLQV